MSTVFRLSNDRNPLWPTTAPTMMNTRPPKRPPTPPRIGAIHGVVRTMPGLEHADRVAGDRERQRREPERGGEEQVDREPHHEPERRAGVGAVLVGDREHRDQTDVGRDAVDAEVREQRGLQHDADDDHEPEADAAGSRSGRGW